MREFLSFFGVDHNILIKKLKLAGIIGSRYFKEQSPANNLIVNGVPQGTVLGPVLHPSYQ